ncbi:MAG: ABC transporter permease [Gammaproteobacteria bacterium]|nr:ABC transporter permease [Gammaproteobacteria bacterium]
MIDIVGLRRTYQVGDIEVHALAGVDLRVGFGEFVAIMGSSGSGKSTLMAILGCLDRPSGGRYLFDGQDVSSLAEPALARIRSERIGFVFQSFNLLTRTSALENAALPLFYRASAPLSRSDRLSRARDALTWVGLEDRAANTPAQLSGGQQQRVAIARALINAPTLLLADEPTGNLDTRTSHELMRDLARFNRERGLTIVVVTHEPDIAAYARRVITMRDGRIVSDELREPVADAVRDATPPPAGPPPPRRMGTDAATPAAARVPGAGFAAMIVGAALRALGRNRMRSALTTLGVFIGVSALIAMVAVGQGANEAVRKQLESLGTNLSIVLPGAMHSGGMRAGFGSASSLTVGDAEAIRRECPDVAAVSYLIRQSGQIQYGNQNWNTGIQAVTANYPPLTNWRIAAGRGFDERDVEDAGLVALLGQTVYRQLFSAGENPIGAMIMVRGVPMRVVGLLAAKGQSPMGQDQDDLVMIPFSTGERRVLGAAVPSGIVGSLAGYPAPPNPFAIAPRLLGYVNVIFVQSVSAARVRAAIDEITVTLNRRHRIRATETADFSVRDLSQIATAAEGSSRVMAILLAVVASISLLVGGVGIMNILLVSVTERTREIGLRMAVGAERVHIMLQFLAEAVILSVVGGLGGIVFGIVVIELIASLARWPTVLSPAAVALGFAFSAAVGIFFGYYPARKAARLDPIEALRYE